MQILSQSCSSSSPSFSYSPSRTDFFNKNSNFLKLFSYSPHSPPSTRTHLRARQPAEWISAQKVEALLKSKPLSVDWQRAAELSVISWGFLKRLQSCSPGWGETRMHCGFQWGGGGSAGVTFALQSVIICAFTMSPRTEMCCFNRTKIPQRLAPHRNKVPGLNPTDRGCMFCPCLRGFPPTVWKHAGRLKWKL